MADIIHMFQGSGGAMAYSTDPSGANLPEEHGPWDFKREVPTDGPTFQAGADRRALEEVKSQGFSVTMFTVTIERAVSDED